MIYRMINLTKMVDIDQIFLLKRKESEGTNNVLAVTKLTTLTQMMPDYN